MTRIHRDAPSTDKDDDFDYLKEIEAIEAQERELEEQRQKKKAELDKLRAEHAKEEHKRSVQRKREMKERKKEAEWLGEPFDDDVETVPVQKKKSKKGIAAIVIIILIAIVPVPVMPIRCRWIRRRLRILNRKWHLSSQKNWTAGILALTSPILLIL